jgi:hypothetical protein
MKNLLKLFLTLLIISIALTTACQQFIEIPASNSAPSTMLVMNGEEDTSKRIHLVAINVTKPNKSYIQRSVQARINEVNVEGGFVIIAHPNVDNDYITREELIAFRNYLGIELDYDHAPTSWDAVLTDRAARSEPMVWGFMTDDAHRAADCGRRYIMLRSPELSQLDILTAVRDGSFYFEDTAIIKDISWSDGTISIKLDREADISFIKRGGEVVKTTSGISGEYSVIGDEGYIRIDVEARNPSARAGTQPFRIVDQFNVSNPYASTGNWYKGNLHAHSTISDGLLTPDEVVKLYAGKGYDFLAITDHVGWKIPDYFAASPVDGNISLSAEQRHIPIINVASP